ncbi:hypothetical protein PHAVU_001G234400 [Phaseolus vulgaris]|uniref:Uncharacterized protein n=1 Tax=Phaseolus vulgaris TaxID=3885 RepID=V7D1M9_PHAVU|nr:hypothetical protein PHAVU_001G234400g [Phaseolus vulgaris]ESW35430.1 hypothetical protein PHAVU_001G234400g [Phaseolus vulgaris]
MLLAWNVLAGEVVDVGEGKTKVDVSVKSIFVILREHVQVKILSGFHGRETPNADSRSWIFIIAICRTISCTNTSEFGFFI